MSCTTPHYKSAETPGASSISRSLVPAKLLPESKSEVGVDLGLLRLATTSDGTIYRNPRVLDQARIELERAQRMVSRRKRGGNRRKLAVRLLRRRHERVANVRREHQVYVAGDLVAKHGFIYVEDLNIQKMVHGKLARSIYDAAALTRASATNKSARPNF